MPYTCGASSSSYYSRPYACGGGGSGSSLLIVAESVLGLTRPAAALLDGSGGGVDAEARRCSRWLKHVRVTDLSTG